MANKGQFKPKKIEFEYINGCKICISHKPTVDGYIRFGLNGKKHLLHRYVYEQKFGPIPDGKVVRHLCNNSRCANIEHLRVGTQKENMKDRENAGNNPIGEKNGRSKLTRKQVTEIRKNSELPFGQLAEKYNISEWVIRDIKKGKTWKHVAV